MRNFSNTAVETTLTALVTASATQINVPATATGYPLPPFTAILAPDASAEEIILVTRRNSQTWDVVRGWGGTAASEHPAGTLVRHGAVAEDFREGAIAYEHLFGAPSYNPLDPTAPPTNTPLIPVGDTVTRSKDTWADLLPDNYVSPIPQPVVAP
jgi:hypothetical protein